MTIGIGTTFGRAGIGAAETTNTFLRNCVKKKKKQMKSIFVDGLL
jgi:hypothetical protein